MSPSGDPPPPPPPPSLARKTEPALAAAVSIAALGVSMLTVLLVTLNFGFGSREIRQDNSANNRAVNGRLDAVHQRDAQAGYGKGTGQGG